MKPRTTVGPLHIIEVFADVWCPFTHVGLKTVAAQLRDRKPEHPGVWVRSWPLEWVNGRPMNPIAAVGHANELRDQLSSDLFVGFDGSHFPHSTIPVLALVARGYREDFELGQSLSFEVRDWLFERGRDVADPATLASIATSFGLNEPDPDDYASVVTDWREGRSRGVLGSPHFYCGRLNVFCPSLEISTNPRNEGKEIHRNISRLSSFLDECLSTKAKNTARGSGPSPRDPSE
jgi:hypothetical protein